MAAQETLPISDKSSRWFQNTLKIIARRVLRFKSLKQNLEEFKQKGGPKAFTFILVKRHSDKDPVRFEGNKILVDNRLFNNKGNFRNGTSKAEKYGLKAALYSAFAHSINGSYNKVYYKMMSKCSWNGKVLGAPGSSRPASEYLKKSKRPKTVEVAIGIKEQACLWCLSCASFKKLNADIFMVNKLKIGRATCPDCQRNLRMMLSNGEPKVRAHAVSNSV